jgi:Tol biopolymer transport system component
LRSGARALVVLLAAALLGGCGDDARPARDDTVAWKIVTEHVDEQTYQETGLDVLVPGARRALARGHRSTRYLTPAWSPDGRYVAFLGVVSLLEGLHVLSEDGSGVHRVVDGALEGFQDFSWSPDGTRLAFVGSCNPMEISERVEDCARGYVGVVSRDGGQSTVVARWVPEGAGYEARHATITLHGWSPDQRRLLYSVEEAGYSGDRLYAVDVDGGSPLVLADSREEGRLLDARWSGDGDLIAYGRGCDDDGCDIAVMEPDGSSKRTVWPGGRASLGPWLPDTSEVLLTLRGPDGGTSLLDVATGRSRLLSKEPLPLTTIGAGGETIGGLDGGKVVLLRPDGTFSTVKVGGLYGSDLWIR